MLFKLLKDLPWMFAIAFIIWMVVAFILWQKFISKSNTSFYQKNKNIVLAVLMAISLTAVDIWYFVEYIPTHFRRDISKERSIALSATDIIKEFQSNENAAYAKYNNKAVELTGEVEKVDADSLSATVILKTAIPRTSVSCRLKTKQDAVIGTTISVKGILTGFIADQVQLSEAIITNNAVSGQAKADAPKDSITITVKDSVKKTVTAVEKPVEAKIYSTNKASIRFFSHTPEEDIEATNSQVISKLNDQSGQLSFAALIKGFHFENELMQDHFNDKDYMNSDEFPKSEFKGILNNLNKIDLTKDGTNKISAAGNLTIHGATQKVFATGTITVAKGKISLKSIFKIKRADYGITTNEIADELEITVTCRYD